MEKNEKFMQQSPTMTRKSNWTINNIKIEVLPSFKFILILIVF